MWHPRSTRLDPDAYDRIARKLADLFQANFDRVGGKATV
jgi:hypothetical protein